MNKDSTEQWAQVTVIGNPSKLLHESERLFPPLFDQLLTLNLAFSDM